MRSRDAGKTSGGGSMGHDQPDDLNRESPVRNVPRTRDVPRQGEERQHEPEGTSERNPTMPDDRPTPGTTI